MSKQHDKSPKETLNELAKLYSEGKLEYDDYKRQRTLLIKDIIKGKQSIIDTSSVTGESPIQKTDKR